jgi:hypothetical protein
MNPLDCQEQVILLLAATFQQRSAHCRSAHPRRSGCRAHRRSG